MFFIDNHDNSFKVLQSKALIKIIFKPVTVFVIHVFY